PPAYIAYHRTPADSQVDRTHIFGGQLQPAQVQLRIGRSHHAQMRMPGVPDPAGKEKRPPPERMPVEPGLGNTDHEIRIDGQERVRSRFDLDRLPVGNVLAADHQRQTMRLAQRAGVKNAGAGGGELYTQRLAVAALRQ
ncbi:hypothetical protein VF11_37495, partial [Nostoc linckia z14]